MQVLIYTKTRCSYCKIAKRTLEKNGIPFTEIDITNDDCMRDEMIAKSGGQRTLPQIFINDRHIGGCDELLELERVGGLKAMVA